MKRPNLWRPKNPWLKNRWMDDRILNVQSLVSNTGIAYHSSRYEGVGQVAARLVSGERKVRTPQGRVLGNAQAEQSDMSATENKPPRNHPRMGSG